MYIKPSRILNINDNRSNVQQKFAFRGTTNPIPDDTAELQTKKKGLSNGAKVAIGLGTIGAIVGGILLHKHFSSKSTTEAVQESTTELRQSIRDLISQGRITQKEADLFNQIYNLDGEEFVTKAYELIAKDMNLEKYPKLIVSTEDKGSTLGHTGKDITIYIKGYERLYGKTRIKEQMINTIRHELEHYKQDIIVFLQKGEKPMQDAYNEQIIRYIDNKALLIGGTSEDLAAVIREEAERVGSTAKCGGDMSELYRMIYEHDSSINTIRTMTPCDFEKLNLTQEELAKADEYLEGIRIYVRPCFPKSFLTPNGELNFETIGQDDNAYRIAQEILYSEGYWKNSKEVGARQAGETLRDKFKLFIEALQ